jgi:hypothetical protein
MQETLSQQDDLRYDNIRILRELEIMREEVAALREGEGASLLQAAAEAESQAAQAQSEALQQVSFYLHFQRRKPKVALTAKRGWCFSSVAV